MGKTKVKRKAELKQITPVDSGNEEIEDRTFEEEEVKMKKKKVMEKSKKEEQIQVKIQTFGEQSDKISPIVGYFPSGFNPFAGPKNHSEEDAAPQLQHRVRVFRHRVKEKRLELVVSPNNKSNVNFVGTNYSGEGAVPQVCTYALGILDKENHTLKVVPINSNKIFRLEPRVGGKDLPVTEQSAVKEEHTAENKADDLGRPNLLYSSKKAIRQAKKLDALRQTGDPSNQEEMDQKLEVIKINMDAVDLTHTTKEARNIPPHDLEATEPHMAYPLDKIIFKGEWDYLLDILELVQEGAEVAANVYPTFVCNRVHRLEHLKDEVEKKRLACIFSYITHLVKFNDKHSMDGVSSAKHRKIPTILFQKFTSMFVDPESKRLSDDKRALLTSYILVLTLFADNFCTDPVDIAKDLRLDGVALRPHFEQLGCKFKREGRLSLATLPAPLQFPELRRRRRR